LSGESRDSEKVRIFEARSFPGFAARIDHFALPGLTLNRAVRRACGQPVALRTQQPRTARFGKSPIFRDPLFSLGSASNRAIGPAGIGAEPRGSARHNVFRDAAPASHLRFRAGGAGAPHAQTRV